MNDKQPLISLCIPTNGVIQWVFPVLESIYAQGVNASLYEVVVMDNGNNSEFKSRMHNYADQHENLVYRETQAYEFLSEIETYRAASGFFIKFINHRTKLREGALQSFIEFVSEYQHTSRKPIVYFSNGVLSLKQDIVHLPSFELFIKELSYFSSWSTGMAFWKSDFDSIPNIEAANVLFPHTKILFAKRNRTEYIIDNRCLLDEIPVGNIPKGRYNLFNAFAVEYPSLILDLYRAGDISIDTFLYVKKANFKFVSELYWDYVIRKKKCSYDLSDYRASISCFYSLNKINLTMIVVFFKKIKSRIYRIFRKDSL